MQKNLIKELSIDFSLESIKVYKELNRKNEFILSKQFLRSATSIGANIHESIASESRNDFIHKLSIALKEAHETKYWMLLLTEGGFYTFSKDSKINDIIKVLSKIIVSLKSQ